MREFSWENSNDSRLHPCTRSPWFSPTFFASLSAAPLRRRKTGGATKPSQSWYFNISSLCTDTRAEQSQDNSLSSALSSNWSDWPHWSHTWVLCNNLTGPCGWLEQSHRKLLITNCQKKKVSRLGLKTKNISAPSCVAWRWQRATDFPVAGDLWLNLALALAAKLNVCLESLRAS